MKAKRKFLALLVIGALCAMMAFAGCSSSSTTDETTTGDTTTTEETTTGDTTSTASAEQEILVTSFGTSYNDSRDATIGAIEQAIADANPDWTVARAFTAQTIIDILAERENLEINNLTEGLEAAAAAGVKKLVVQPTHLMAGLEYQDVVSEVEAQQGSFEQVAIGKNLLDTDADFQAVADAIVDVTSSYDDGQTAIVFMGHGTEDDANSVYSKLQQVLTDGGYTNYYIGTVEATPSYDDVAASIEGKGYTKVVLRPLMVVAGDHANNDMASLDDPDSWASKFTAAGYDVTPVLEGLGQIPAIQELYVQHCAEAIAELS